MSVTSTRIVTIKMRDEDNVAVIANAGGLPEGMRLGDGTVLGEAVPQGHKVALSPIAKGEAILRYGAVIGHALEDIPRGYWVAEALVHMPPPPDLDDLPAPRDDAPASEPLDGYTFEGYRNGDGTVGTRNILGITTSVQCVAGVIDHVVKRIRDEMLPRYPNVDDVVALTHTYGCGVAINAPAAIVPIRTLQNLVHNPNFGGEVMVIGLGCEKLRPEMLLPKGAECGTMLSLQDKALAGFGGMVAGILETAEGHLQRLNTRTRETCPASDLVVGMQCGGSDAFSGITANPAVGFATDLIVRTGGSVMFSEVTEVRDAIHLLTPRAADETVAEGLRREMAWYDDYLRV